MDPDSSPFMTLYLSFHVLFHSVIPTLNPKPCIIPIIPEASMFFSIPTLTLNPKS